MSYKCNIMDFGKVFSPAKKLIGGKKRWIGWILTRCHSIGSCRLLFLMSLLWTGAKHAHNSSLNLLQCRSLHSETDHLMSCLIYSTNWHVHGDSNLNTRMFTQQLALKQTWTQPHRRRPLFLDQYNDHWTYNVQLKTRQNTNIFFQ